MTVDPGLLAERWEGASRPGHFRGVATGGAILFEVTRPTVAYFGQKDYQQALIIQRMVRDLHMPLRVRILPTVREPDGLAMSSRNAYLSREARAQAVVMFQALQHGRRMIRAGQRRAGLISAQMRRVIRRVPNARIEYLAITHAATLKLVSRAQGRIAIVLAVRIGATRLIDNLLVDVT